jgi:hypothetical protein
MTRPPKLILIHRVWVSLPAVWGIVFVRQAP